MTLVPVSPEVNLPFLPFVFDIAVGARRGDSALHAALDAILARKAPEIDALLDEHGVPCVTRLRAVR